MHPKRPRLGEDRGDRKLSLEFAFTPSSFTPSRGRRYRAPRKPFVPPPAPPAPENYDSFLPAHLRRPPRSPLPHSPSDRPEDAAAHQAPQDDGDVVIHTFSSGDDNDGPAVLAEGMLLERGGKIEPVNDILADGYNMMVTTRRQRGVFSVVQHLILKEMAKFGKVRELEPGKYTAI